MKRRDVPRACTVRSLPAVVLAGSLMALLVSVGCKNDRPPIGLVAGTVTLAGKPLEGASIRFQPEQGRESLANTDAAGHYELNYVRSIRGAKVGPHRVVISKLAEGVPAQETLPAKYNQNTTLVVEVKKGRNTLNFELEP